MTTGEFQAEAAEGLLRAVARTQARCAVSRHHHLSTSRPDRGGGPQRQTPQAIGRELATVSMDV